MPVLDRRLQELRQRVWRAQNGRQRGQADQEADQPHADGAQLRLLPW